MSSGISPGALAAGAVGLLAVGGGLYMKSQSDKAAAEAKAAQAKAEADRREAELRAQLAQQQQQQQQQQRAPSGPPARGGSDVTSIIGDVLNFGLPLLGSLLG